MDDRSIRRISELTQLSRERALTEAEMDERHRLRAAYLTAFRGQMCAQLDNTVVQYPDGTRVPFRDAAKKRDK